MSEHYTSQMSLLDQRGQRKYLNKEEREAFYQVALLQPPKRMTYCLMLYYTGCRLSEALELTPERVDPEGIITIRSLKKRGKLKYRQVNVPPSFIAMLDKVHNLQKDRTLRLWPFSRKSADRYVKSTMVTAGITDRWGTAKGLRHGFGLACAQNNVPLPLIQKWMGHSKVDITAIYLDIQGEEEKGFATRIWSSH